MKVREQTGIKAPVYASLALAFASFGDAFLYPFLPVNNLAVGVPIVWVGVLLSINRFVRILSNTWVVHLFSKYGLRLITRLSVVLAILSTAGYSVATNVFVWLVLRVMWGLSFSAMRISTLGFALQHHQSGFALGLSRGIQEAGPVVVLLIAPQLLKNFSVQDIFLILTCLSMPAVFFAFQLPTIVTKTSTTSRRLFPSFPSPINSITFLTAVFIDGIMVVALGVLFLNHKENITILSATTLAALYLGYRRVCLVVLSPAGGWMADKFGLEKIFNLSLLAVIIGLASLSLGWVELGAVVVFTFYSINVAITPGRVSNQQGHALTSVAVNATWRDIGAAVGTLGGGFLLSTSYLTTVLIFSTFGLVLVFLIHLGTAKHALKLLYLWK